MELNLEPLHPYANPLLFEPSLMQGVEFLGDPHLFPFFAVYIFMIFSNFDFIDL